MVSECHHDVLVVGFCDDDVVRKAAHDEPLDAAIAGRPGRRHQRKQVVLEQAQRGVDCCMELDTESRSGRLVSSSGLDRFLHSGFE